MASPLQALVGLPVELDNAPYSPSPILYRLTTRSTYSGPSHLCGETWKLH